MTSGTFIEEDGTLKPPPACGGRFGGGNATSRNLKAMKNADALRKNLTEAEKKLWSILRGKQLSGFKFRRQQSIGPYIVDFACMKHHLVIELDGGQHAMQESYDAGRTVFLEEHGFQIIRFWNNDVTENMDGVYQRIVETLNSPTPTLPRKREREKATS
ncbi:MAG: endonuclease domain-containing protein [Rickettsiales bacterium]